MKEEKPMPNSWPDVICTCPDCLPYDKCKKHCSHEDATLVKAIANTHLCVKCSANLVSNEIYVNYEYVEMGAFCDNEKCERYMILVA